MKRLITALVMFGLVGCDATDIPTPSQEEATQEIPAAEPECANSRDCSDGLFCNGYEICRNGGCLAGEVPCSDGLCNEDTGQCDPTLEKSLLEGVWRLSTPGGTSACLAIDRDGKIYDWRDNCGGANLRHLPTVSISTITGERTVRVSTMVVSMSEFFTMTLTLSYVDVDNWTGSIDEFSLSEFSLTGVMNVITETASLQRTGLVLSSIQLSRVEEACGRSRTDGARSGIQVWFMSGISWSDAISGVLDICDSNEDEFVKQECLTCNYALVDDIYGVR